MKIPIFAELKKMPYAKGQLKKLAKGKAHAMNYDLFDYTTDRIDVHCSVYISGSKYTDADTWEEALQKMREQIKGKEIL